MAYYSRHIESDAEMQKIHAIRNEVFIVEQKVSREEEYENEVAEYYLVFDEDHLALGTGRWRKTKNGIKIERMAVLKQARAKGAGSILLDKMLEEIPRDQGTIYLNAQVAAMNYYLRAGFVAEGELFYEANIPHYRMVLNENP